MTLRTRQKVVRPCLTLLCGQQYVMLVFCADRPILIRDCHCVGCHDDFKWFRGIKTDDMCQYLCEQEKFCVIALRNVVTKDCYLYWRGAESMDVVTGPGGHPFTCIARYPTCMHNTTCQPDPEIAAEVQKRIDEAKKGSFSRKCGS